MAVRHFRHIFEGQELTIYTDHKPLTYALSTQSKNETPRRARYLDYIGQFAYEIKYISGKDNEVADALSRVETISCPSPINYEQLAQSQKHDVELDNLQNRSNLKFQAKALPDSSATIICETSTGVPRPYLTVEFRKLAYEAIHKLSHPGIRGTRKLVTARFFWPSMNKDVNEWTRTCIPCQKSKVQRHVHSPLENFEFAEKLQHVHIDIIGPLPISNGYRYCLTMIDRATKWTEASPITDITADTVATAFYEGWISRFGTPEKVTTDRGTQFQSELFRNLAQRMGIQQNRTTAYHPQTNGIVERWHRTLKCALTSRLNADNWSYELPTVLLGLRAAVKEDIGYSAAELLYGQTIRLPGEFCGARNNLTHSSNLMDNISNAIRKSQEQRKQNCRPIFIPQDLLKCDHVLVRNDAVRKPLTPTYDGPYPVIERSSKFYKICKNKKFINISIDRLKPADTVKSPDQEITQETKNYAHVTRYGRVSKPPERFAEGGVV